MALEPGASVDHAHPAAGDAARRPARRASPRRSRRDYPARTARHTAGPRPDPIWPGRPPMMLLARPRLFLVLVVAAAAGPGAEARPQAGRATASGGPDDPATAAGGDLSGIPLA